MLQLKNISRVYKTDDIETKALDGVSTNFRKSEFVSILGPSGSGKTTLLNIIGGLDHYTSGDIIIDGISTKDYKDRDWDAYRNHRVGFIFQSYNLISHQSVLSNVELALTLSGISGSKKKKLATEALEKVGLKEQISKRPSQLSGGQMQRVAIARALVNNPDIVLADEPTGALDSKTSVQIMDLLKDIAKDKLVIMVTHNPDLAKTYSSRIINVKDGKIISDTKPYDGKSEAESETPTRYTSLSLLTALQLSKNNLMTKRGRTILTAIAGSIGIIGIALILALANGVNKYADSLLTSGSTPSAITVERSYIDSSISSFDLNTGSSSSAESGTLVGTDDISTNIAISRQKQVRFNDTKALKAYLDAQTNLGYIETIHYSYDYTPEVYANGIKVNPVEGGISDIAALFGAAEKRADTKAEETDIVKSSFKEIVTNRPYELLEGKLPESKNELLLVLDKDSKIPLSTLYSLDILPRADLSNILDRLNSGESYTFKSQTLNLKDILGKSYETRFEDGSKESLSVVGIAKVKDEGDSSGYMGYTHTLVEEGIKRSSGKYDLATPEIVDLYAKSNDDKAQIKSLLDEFNSERADKVTYVDQTEVTVKSIKDVVNMLSYVLIAFVAISLIVSSIMIGIITYISVLERTKEIGILRAIGASKRDVVRVFLAETIIEGLIAGLLGTLTSALLCFVANFLVSTLAKIDGLVQFSPVQALLLIAISVVLTVFAGASPARRASKKDPVEALRTE